jgi:hypothetical protein
VVDPNQLRLNSNQIEFQNLTWRFSLEQWVWPTQPVLGFLQRPKGFKRVRGNGLT